MKKAALDIKMYEEEERQKKLTEAGINNSGLKEEVPESVERRYEGNEKAEDFY
jgi:hypothetical protein